MKEGSTKKKWWWTSLFLPVVVGLIVEVFTDVEVLSTLWGLVNTIGTTPIPLWLAILLVVAGVGAVFGWAWFMRWLHYVEVHEVDVPEHYSFTKLRLLGIDWEWEWYAGDITNLLILCPNCKNELELRSQGSGYKDLTMCENCGFVELFEVEKVEVVKRAYKEIRRLVRTGEYKKRLGSKSEDV